jgi:hypothetical protein
VDRTVFICKDDDRVLAVQQVIDLFVDALYVRAESLAECHSSASVIMRRGRSVGLVIGRRRGSRTVLLRSAPDGRSSSARSDSRDRGPTALAIGCALFVARERRNDSSCARSPNANLSVFSASRADCLNP